MLLSMASLSTPEQTIAMLAIFGLIGAALYGLCQWVVACPRKPDPWEADLEPAGEGAEALPLCPRCLAPQAHPGWFCPECGSAAASQYGNYLPAVYIFSMGDGLRAAVERPGRWTPLVATGCALVGFLPFSPLAPIYGLFLFAQRARINRQRRAARRETSE
jgi:hypothetical protein